MNHGKLFERTIARSWVETGVNLERLNLVDIGSENPCDEVVIGNLILYNELKSTKNTRFTLNMVKLHQIKSLYKLHQKRDNVYGLVLIEFVKYNTMVWIKIDDYIKMIKNGISSIKFEDITKNKIVKNGDIYPLNSILEELNG